MKLEYNKDKQKDSPPSECKCKDIPRNSSVYPDKHIIDSKRYNEFGK